MNDAQKRIRMSKFINMHDEEEMREIGKQHNIIVPTTLESREDILKYLLDKGLNLFQDSDIT